MASSFNTFGLVSLAVLLPFFVVSASASTKFIDAICHTDVAFCVQTLTTYPPVASATDELQAARATLCLVTSHAEKSAALAKNVAMENPNLKKQFEAIQDAFMDIKFVLKNATLELNDDPAAANQDVGSCTDYTTIVKNLVRENTDKASKTVMQMTLMMDRLLAIANWATVTVGGDESI